MVIGALVTQEVRWARAGAKRLISLTSGHVSWLWLITAPLHFLKTETSVGIKKREEVNYSDLRDPFCRQAKDDKRMDRKAAGAERQVVKTAL